MLERFLEKKICAQTTVIRELNGTEKAGPELREIVNHDLVEQRFGRMSGPAFYQFMSEMEDRGVVVGESRPTIVEGATIQERWYRYSGGGTRFRKSELPATEELGFGGLLGPQPAW